MNNTPIKENGYCINQLIERLENKIGKTAAHDLKKTAIEVVQNCVDVYAGKFGVGDVGLNGTGSVNRLHTGDIPNDTTGLIYGRVQSGKTNATIATLAIAQENGFRCFIVLTSDNTWLGKQTANRFNEQLDGGPVVFDWEQWKTDTNDFAANKLGQYIDDTGVVLVSTKNANHLKNLLAALKAAKAHRVPTLIFDDEADNASLNTNEAKQSKKGKDTIPDSAIFDWIGKIRKEVSNHIYIQITATPQSLLLQNLDHPCKPTFCAALPEPGDSYMGGELFFQENSLYCHTIDGEEIQQLVKQQGKINPGEEWSIPKGLRLALCCFFLGAVYKMKTNPEDKYSFLAHICYKKDNHSTLEKIISSFVQDLDKALRGKSSSNMQNQAKQWLEDAYKELKKTTNDLPELSNLIEELKHKLRRAIPTVINANNPDKEPNYHTGMNILVGGNRLGRGVTIEGLMVTYYGRDAKQKVMDTVHQHARMYGYRQKLKDVTRLFLPEHILEAFRDIHEADTRTRQAIGNDPSNIKIQPVWVGKSLRPTRSNVLNLTAIGLFTPGTQIFPRSPLWKTSDIKEDVEKLDNLLKKFEEKTEKEEYEEVEIDFMIDILTYMRSSYYPRHPWENTQIKELLIQIKAKGILKGRINVFRGQSKTGRKLKRQEPSQWGGFGFASGKELKKIKDQYPDVPTLAIFYQEGNKAKGWDNQPLYLPMLVPPKHNFVFMFNYSE